LTLNERIKKLRKSLDLTQQEFSGKIGTTANVLTNYETGRRNPSNSVINNICKTFNVSEDWLRDGTGEMFVKPAMFSLDKYAAEHGATELELAIAKAYFDLPPGVRTEMLGVLKNLLNSVDTIPGTAAPGEKTLEQEADEFAALAREQFVLERKAALQASSVRESDVG